MDPYESYEPPTLDSTQPVNAPTTLGATLPSQPRLRRGRGCSPRLLILIGVILAVYFFSPLRTNLLVLGIDRTPEGTDIGRSDTMILLSARPLTGQINMLSIPRDLWVGIPNYGENRINAAHAFGEGEQTGHGPQLAVQTVRENFGVSVNYYLRIRLTGFAGVIDALGGVPITLQQEVAGLPPGDYVLNGAQAMAFVRDRTGDDFFRMAHGQLFVVALGKKLINPLSWWRFPGALISLGRMVDTNLPIWLWPRFVFVFVRAILFNGFDARTLPREAVIPWLTDAGAQVLLPNWDLIRPLVREMFALF